MKPLSEWGNGWVLVVIICTIIITLYLFRVVPG